MLCITNLLKKCEKDDIFSQKELGTLAFAQYLYIMIMQKGEEMYMLIDVHLQYDINVQKLLRCHQVCMYTF